MKALLLSVLSLIATHHMAYGCDSSDVEMQDIDGLDIFESIDADLLQNNILILLNLKTEIHTISLINRRFYTRVTGHDPSLNDQSEQQRFCTFKINDYLVKDIIKRKNKLLQLRLIEPYAPNHIPRWIMHEINEVANIHPSWWPKLKDTCASSFTIAKMPICMGTLEDSGTKKDEEELERWTQILQKENDVPTFKCAFSSGVLLDNWFECLCKHDPFLAGKISNYVDDEKIIALANFLKESSTETLTFSGLPIGEEALKRFTLQIQGSKITKIILGTIPKVSDATRIFLKQTYPNIDWHFDDGSIGCTIWRWRD